MQVQARSLEEQIRAAGLEVAGCCEQLSKWPELMKNSFLLEDFTPEEADVLGSLMLHVRAQPGQMLIVEGDADDWMLLLLRGTVDVGKRIGREAEREERGDNTRLAVLRLRCTLLENSAGGERLVAQRSFDVQRPAPSADAAGGVRALTAASEAAAQEIAAWLRQP